MEQKHYSLMPGEVELKKNLASYLKSAINVDSGTLRLTNQRLLFCGEFGTMMKLATVGALALLSKKGPKIHFQFPLDKIESITIKKHGLSKKMVLKPITGKEVSFAPTHFEEWMAEFENLGISINSTIG
jgi:hypothetical protein